MLAMRFLIIFPPSHCTLFFFFFCFDLIDRGYSRFLAENSGMSPADKAVRDRLSSLVLCTLGSDAAAAAASEKDAPEVI